MDNCLHLPDYAGEPCAGCGEEIDRYGNTESDFNACCFPDCGCDGARLCMAPNGASEQAGKYNGEGMYNSPDPKARMAFIGAVYGGEFGPAQGMSTEGENSRSEVEGEACQPGPKDAPNPISDTPNA